MQRRACSVADATWLPSPACSQLDWCSRPASRTQPCSRTPEPGSVGIAGRNRRRCAPDVPPARSRPTVPSRRQAPSVGQSPALADTTRRPPSNVELSRNASGVTTMNEPTACRSACLPTTPKRGNIGTRLDKSLAAAPVTPQPIRVRDEAVTCRRLTATLTATRPDGASRSGTNGARFPRETDLGVRLETPRADLRICECRCGAPGWRTSRLGGGDPM